MSNTVTTRARSSKPCKENSKYKMWVLLITGKTDVRYSFPNEDTIYSAHQIAETMKDRFLIKHLKGIYKMAMFFDAKTDKLIYRIINNNLIEIKN
jgi:hypothetical protein